MNHLTKLLTAIRRQLFLVLIIENLALIGIWWLIATFTPLNDGATVAVLAFMALCFALIIMVSLSNYLIQPVQALWQAILHLSPDEHGIAAPRVDELSLGRELVVALTTQVYQLAEVAEHAEATSKAESIDISHNAIAQSFPLPFFVLDPSETILFVNQAASDYIGIPVKDLIGKNVYMVLDMSFPSEDTFDTWLKNAKQHSVTATETWERVRLNVRDNHPTLLFDLAAYYNKDNAEKHETMLVLFDHTKQYSQDDQAVSFIALSVHELRTPLTMLRGYIEVLNDELGETVNPELKDFMLKMHTIAEQLTAFVNNILNVARIDNDQFTVELHEANWADVLKSSTSSVELRAKVRGITIETTVAPDLPPVAVDALSIREVINNLVDNAIKYSGDSKVIKIDAHLGKDGSIETTVQDYGLGISTAIMPNLFTKFYRDHRNRAQIGGTGLGLYLSKTIVDAHGGQLWVKSKEGEGSTFGFTLQPYAALSEEAKQSGNKELVRSAHGWIKNHSLYRR